MKGRLLLALTVAVLSFAPSAARGEAADSPHEEQASLNVPGGSLYGSLLIPAHSTPVPMVLLISGSGPTDRDGNTPLIPGKNDSLKLLAQALVNHEVASLRYDKRGIAASVAAGRDESRLRFDNYIDDTTSWGEKLRKDQRFSSLVLIGHSEGSLIGAVAAQRIPADGFVSLEGAGRPAPDVILSQLRPKLSQGAMTNVEELIAKLKAGETTRMAPPGLEGLFRPSVQPYLISWFTYDPVQEIRKLPIPLLIIQGTTDTQLTLEDATRLVDANLKARLVMIDGMNHVLRRVPPGEARQVTSFRDPSLPIEPRLVHEIADFVGKLPRPGP
jgi:pimeloyl-ACP methyl ester carboxylesterase